VLRRTDRPARAWFLDGVEEVDADGGEALLEVLGAAAQLADADDAALLAARPRVAGGMLLEQVLRSEHGGWENAGVNLRRSQGLHISLRADVRVATLFLRCDGKRTVAELGVEVARELGASTGIDAEGTLRSVRLLVERGVLTLS